MNLDGMYISVIAYKEPKHLYVCLDALTKVNGIEDFPITVYVDGILSPALRQKQEDVLGAFPGVAAEFSTEHLGIRENVMRGLRRPVENGASLILYIEDDHLLRRDALDVPLNDDTGCFFVGLSLSKKQQVQEYIAKGNVITSDNALKLLAWLDSKAYLGMTRYDNQTVMGPEYAGHDLLLNMYLREHEEYSSFPLGFYLAHFGLFGTNYPRYEVASEILAVEKRMFAGRPDQWLDNIVGILESSDYPTSPRVLNARLWPRGFRYYGEVAIAHE